MRIVETLTFIFDKNNLIWQNDMEFNEAFIQTTVKCLGELFTSRHYILKKEVYGAFGFKWGPEQINWFYAWGEDGDEIRLGYIESLDNMDGMIFQIMFVAN